MTDGQFLLRSDDKRVSFLLLLFKIGQLTVVHLWSISHGCQCLGIMAQSYTDQRHERVGSFLISHRLGENHDITLEPYLLEVSQGDTVGHPTIEQLVSFQLHHMRHHGHGGRSPNPVVCLMSSSRTFLIYRLTCLHICTNDIELRWILLKSIVVELIIFLGNYMVSIFRSEEIARFQVRLQTAVFLVVGKPHVIANGAPYLS